MDNIIDMETKELIQKEIEVFPEPYLEEVLDMERKISFLISVDIWRSILFRTSTSSSLLAFIHK
ncbi:Uncharacterised protein [uncultured archaeon]|nr:Uncharacterised protein [uncultured archaeon]